jgi:hypothetical protein
MPQHEFRLFGNLAFLQSLDKEGILSRFLSEYRTYFTRQGLDVDALSNDDACARRLLEIFTRPDERMPGELLRDLYVLDELADEDGHQRILDEADRLKMDLRSIPSDICAGDFAITVFLRHSRLIRICHEKTIARQVKRYYEYRSRDQQRFTLIDIEAGTRVAKAALGPWFEERRRTRKCETFVYRDGDEIRILITHGGLFRADGNITHRLELSRIPWRPQKHDSIIYDMRTGVLKVHARLEAERQVYRETLGQALASDAGFFLAGPCYTLEPLRSNSGVLTLVDGVNGARLTEVVVEADSADCRQAQLKGDNLTKVVAGRGDTSVPAGEIVRACFALSYTTGGRARKLEVRLPNVADHDRDRDGIINKDFLRANGLVVVNHADAEGLVDAA